MERHPHFSVVPQVKGVAQAVVEDPVGRYFSRIGKPASQAIAVKHIAVNRGSLINVGGPGSGGVALIMIEKHPMVLDKRQPVGSKQKFAGIDFFAGPPLESEIEVGVKSTLSVVRCHLTAVLVSMEIVKR